MHALVFLAGNLLLAHDTPDLAACERFANKFEAAVSSEADGTYGMAGLDGAIFRAGDFKVVCFSEEQELWELASYAMTAR